MWLLSRWSWKFSRFLSEANLSEYIYAQLFNCWQYILKVSDTQFSLTASYILAFMWHDKRIFFKETPQATTHVLDYNVLKKIWTPKLKVENRLCNVHSKMSSLGQARQTQQQWQRLRLLREVSWNCDDGWKTLYWVDQPHESRDQLSHVLQVLPVWHADLQLHHRALDVRCPPDLLAGGLKTVGQPEYRDELQHLHPAPLVQVQSQGGRPSKEGCNKSLSNFFSQDTEAHIKQLFPDRTDFNTYTVGFTYVLARKYSKFIFIYYIPRYKLVNHFGDRSRVWMKWAKPLFDNLALQLSLCCVFLGFLLDITKGLNWVSAEFSHCSIYPLPLSHPPNPNICQLQHRRWFQVVWVSSLPFFSRSLGSSSPPYLPLRRWSWPTLLLQCNAENVKSFFSSSGVSGLDCPDLLGSRSLPFHIWGNHCLRGSTNSDQVHDIHHLHLFLTSLPTCSNWVWSGLRRTCTTSLRRRRTQRRELASSTRGWSSSSPLSISSSTSSTGRSVSMVKGGLRTDETTMIDRCFSRSQLKSSLEACSKCSTKKRNVKICSQLCNVIWNILLLLSI